MPRVSVIIPTFNHARFVACAVESALAQAYVDREVVVVDDGSTDDTWAVLRPYATDVTLIRQENAGVSAARNAGLQMARGEYLLFLDADDIMAPHQLARQVPLLDALPDAGLVYCSYQHVAADGRRVLHLVRPCAGADPLADLLCRRLAFPPGAALLRRTCLEAVGPFDVALSGAADTDLWARLALAGYRFVHVDEPLFQYRVVPGSMSNQIDRQERDEFARLRAFFAAPDLPGQVAALEPQARAALHYEFAAKWYTIGALAQAQDHLRRAIAACPDLAADAEWLLEWLAGYALTTEAADPQGFIDGVFDHLPAEASALRPLRHRAHGRYHIAAAFAAAHQGQSAEVRSHILPALRGDPAVLRNRGFVAIAVRSLLRRVTR
jgi:hypothetical protein